MVKYCIAPMYLAIVVPYVIFWHKVPQWFTIEFNKLLWYPMSENDIGTAMV